MHHLLKKAPASRVTESGSELAQNWYCQKWLILLLSQTHWNTKKNKESEAFQSWTSIYISKSANYLSNANRSFFIMISLFLKRKVESVICRNTVYPSIFSKVTECDLWLNFQVIFKYVCFIFLRFQYVVKLWCISILITVQQRVLERTSRNMFTMPRVGNLNRKSFDWISDRDVINRYLWY